MQPALHAGGSGHGPELAVFVGETKELVARLRGFTGYRFIPDKRCSGTLQFVETRFKDPTLRCVVL